MGRAIRASDHQEQHAVADGIFASLEALKIIAKAANLPEIHAKLDMILGDSLDAHVGTLRAKLEAMHRSTPDGT